MKVVKSAIQICLSLLPVFANAQFDPNWGFVNPQQADSLKKSLSIEKNDTLRMAANRSLGFYYQETKLDSALYFHQQQLKLAKKLDIKMWLADAYSQVGYQLLTMGNATQAYDNFIEAEKIAEDKENEKSNWHYSVFSNSKNLHDARLSILAMNYNGFGNLYLFIDEPGKDIDAFNETIRIGQQIGNKKILVSAYGNIAANLSPDSMILYSKMALQYADEGGYKKNNGLILLLIAKAFGLNHDLDSAAHYVDLSINANIQQKNLRGLSLSYWAKATLQSLKNDIDSSLLYAKKSLAIAELVKMPDLFLNAYTSLATGYGVKKMNDSAYKYGQLAYNLNDSLKNARLKQLTDFQKFAFNEQLRLKQLNDDKTSAQNKLKLYAAIVGLAALLFVALILSRNNHQKQKANKVLESTLNDLKATQSQLIQSEKMASLGELTAGIAHEIQNPLNFVNNFSEINQEMIDEMKNELANGNIQQAIEIANDIKENEEKINHHGKRADAIVKGMLQHSRSSTGKKEPTDINAFANEYFRLAYHGLRAKDKSFNAKLETDFDDSIGEINMVPQDMGRVILNLITNAFYVVDEKKKSGIENYEPTVKVSTKNLNNAISISVKDNGNGIPAEIVDKIFQPFFTTKPTGKGTGLGLSMSYDIVTNGHKGQLNVETKPGEGTTFIIKIPKNNTP